MQMQLHGLNMTLISIEQRRVTLWWKSIRTQNLVKDKTGNSLKIMGQTKTRRFESHVCTSRKEDGIYRLTTIEIAKQKRKITRSILKRCKNIKIGSAFSFYWKHNSERMKIKCPSISTNRAINWYHHYLTLATHASKRQWGQIHDRLERDTNTIWSQNKSCKSCQYKRHSQKCRITRTLSWL